MTMQRPMKIGTLAALLAILVAVPTAGNHFTLIGDDSRFQDGRWSGPENWTFYWWARTGASMWWWAESSIDAATTQAVNGWASALGMPFLKVSSQSSADIAVVVDTSIGAYGYMSLTEVRIDSTAGGNYSYKGEAVIRNAGSAPQGGWQGTIAHEIGHFIGLHERYRDDGSSSSWCNSESTIMNSGSCSNRPSSPSSLDIGRVNGMYKTGDLPSMTATSSGGTYNLSWKDSAWGERAHELQFFFYDPSAGWQSLQTVNHLDQIGMHETSYHTRTLNRSWSRSSFGRPAGWYCGCGWSVHIRGGPGTWRCGTVIWLS